MKALSLYVLIYIVFVVAVISPEISALNTPHNGLPAGLSRPKTIHSHQRESSKYVELDMNDISQRVPSTNSLRNDAVAFHTRNVKSRALVAAIAGTGAALLLHYISMVNHFFIR